MKSHFSADTRRTFIRKAAILTGAASSAKWLGAPAILSAASPNSQLGIAVIACGGMGGGDPEIAAKERLVALVDVDEKKLGEAVKKVEAKAPNPQKRFFGIPARCSKVLQDIDVVLIAAGRSSPAAMRDIRRTVSSRPARRLFRGPRPHGSRPQTQSGHSNGQPGP